MEQLVLYLAVLAALAGFGMGLLNIAGPLLARRNLALPKLSLATLLRPGESEEEDFELALDEDLDADRAFAESGFASNEVPLLTRRLTVVEDEDEDLDDELVQVLDEIASEPAPEDDEVDAEEEDGPFIYTVSADLEDETEVSDEESDESEDGEDEFEDEEDDDEDGEREAEAPAVQVVAAGAEAGDDMLSFFNESADAGKDAAPAWREDLPDVGIEELLAEARSLRQQIKGRKSNAA
jgi:hypothetical protein